MRNQFAKLLAWFGWTVTPAAQLPVDVRTVVASIPSTDEREAVVETIASTVVDRTPDIVAPHAVGPSSRRLALRLKSVSRVNKVSRRGKYRALARKKRAPDLYPMKRRAAVARKPELKVLRTKPKVRPSAMVIPFPSARVRKAKLKLAA